MSSHRPTGQHLLADLHGIDPARLRSAADIDTMLRAAAVAAGATILHSHFHSFGDGQGITGVVLLAESHISIHTWPEYGFAAADIFMCGASRPQLALDLIQRALEPAKADIQAIERGV
jgi:S-adenosylmethionine decarboxylase